MKLRLDGKFKKSWRAIVVYVTFAMTILLWMTTKVHGMNTYVVAIIPLAVFTLTGIMGKKAQAYQLGCAMAGSRWYRYWYCVR